jgi:aminoglycoside phosphotransferase family enzyme
LYMFGLLALFSFIDHQDKRFYQEQHSLLQEKIKPILITHCHE